MSAVAAAGQTSMAADGVLLEAVRQGDNTAFEELFTRYYPRVYGVLLRVVRTPEDAEEIAHDVFMRLYERPLDYVTDGALAGWLYRTALNAGFNALRSRKRRSGWLRKAAMFQRAEPAFDTGPAAVVERNEEIERVRQALTQIPEKQRNALVLRSHGLQYNEIAAALDISSSSIGTTLARGERALRRQLENEVHFS
ncbi:MAG: sigma-70 family RNA polymerase sigma factor [Chloroflexia bacterium]|nr:sigma-70 family RNA polymerase sigma factor [Chloroflexia bacterium]